MFEIGWLKIQELRVTERDFNIRSRTELEGFWQKQSIGQKPGFVLSLVTRHLISGIVIILSIVPHPIWPLLPPDSVLNVKKFLNWGLVSSNICLKLWLQFPVRKLLTKVLLAWVSMFFNHTPLFPQLLDFYKTSSCSDYGIFKPTDYWFAFLPWQFVILPLILPLHPWHLGARQFWKLLKCWVGCSCSGCMRALSIGWKIISFWENMLKPQF